MQESVETRSPSWPSLHLDKTWTHPRFTSIQQIQHNTSQSNFFTQWINSVALPLCLYGINSLVNDLLQYMRTCFFNSCVCVCGLTLDRKWNRISWFRHVQSENLSVTFFSCFIVWIPWLANVTYHFIIISLEWSDLWHSFSLPLL